MPYAANGVISEDPIDGGISISAEQYRAALAGMQEGKTVSVGNGLEIKDAPLHPEPGIPGAPDFYIISKMTPWLRMTDEEAAIVRAAMDRMPIRLQEIYKSAPYLQSNDALWPTLQRMLASCLPPARADELLAPETADGEH
ncbi:hypothetical protein FHT87_005147 [Rhizobium sp. BK316]|uniref:hypothetical protein n=1 Tax=Rhizobium sp. BK316 TaxID=2587053 RepID=UPI001617FCFE|nr:hypothetical protein [Rhizobium sp. BK316]MBB3411194.1 hypothetical protein [Rhizobium sp. BK316]